MRLALLLANLLAVLISSAQGGDSWGYHGKHGPEHWGGLCSSGRRQSPIDVSPNESDDGEYEPLVFINFNHPTKMDIVNNGHTVQMTAKQPNLYLAAGGLKKAFKLEQIHFHWPAEHTINGERSLLEMHMVHSDYNLNGMKSASLKPRGIAVIGVMFYESAMANPGLDSVINKLSDISYPGEKSSLDLLPQDLLPRDTSRFYRYEGSLTTPGCNEAVVWTILAVPVPASVDQLQVFPKILGHNNQTLSSNFRPIQKLNGRTIFYQSGSSAANFLSASLIAFIAILATYLVK